MKRFLAIHLLAVASLVSACGRGAADASKAGGFSIPVETVAASVERVEDKLVAVGTLEANEMVQVRSEVAGRIVAVEFNEGDPVKKDAVLFRLDDGKLRAQLESTEARLMKARNNLERSRKLLEQTTISPQEFDDAQAEFKEAQAAVDLAREQFDDATIRSPLDGFISERLVSNGQYVEKDRTLVTVVDTDPVKIDTTLPERFLPQLQLGQKVNVKIAGLGQKAFTGEVYFIDPRVDPSTRTVKIKARIPNPDGELRPGLFANVELVTGTRDNAIVVPEQAIVPAIDKLTVFVVEGGVARRREVTVGARLPGKVEITSGIQTGEMVVISGQQKLRDQMPVIPKPKEG